jgi:hypothetical protein
MKTAIPRVKIVTMAMTTVMNESGDGQDCNKSEGGSEKGEYSAGVAANTEVLVKSDHCKELSIIVILLINNKS